MVTSRTFERLTRISPRIAYEAGTSEEVVKKVLASAQSDLVNRRRQPAVPPPEDGISIRAAARKYKIGATTISLWVKKGLIPVVLETKNEKYIKESIVTELVHKYKNYSSEGRKTIKNVLSGGFQCSPK